MRPDLERARAVAGEKNVGTVGSGLGKVRACWFHEACDAGQCQQTGGMAARRGATRASGGTDRLIAGNVNVRHRGVGNPATRTVLSCGYRCVTGSIALVARSSPAATSKQPARQAGGAPRSVDRPSTVRKQHGPATSRAERKPGRMHWRHEHQANRRPL